MSHPALRVMEGQARKYRHTWRASVFSSFVNPALMLAAMGLGLGSLVDRNGGPGGVSYLSFLAPGLLAATAMQTAAGEAAYPIRAGLEWIKSFPAAVATPVSAADLVLGILGWAGIRILQVVTTFAIVEVLFGAVPIPAAAAALVPSTITGLAFAAPIAAYTAHLRDDNGLSMLFRFGIVPLFLFSGTFFPISQLPAWMQPVAFFTPLWHGVEWTRGWALGSTPVWPWWAHAFVLGGVIFFGAHLAVRGFERKLNL
jgi:lipooligosaccharide transport system permease protein